jgi:uncharacterized tellurite resistance protein B-like protein
MTAYSTDDLDRTKVRANTTGISALHIMYIAAMAQLLENDVARSYALALLAIARGDGTIGPDEAEVFQQRLEKRVAKPLPLDELLFERPISATQVADLVTQDHGPFRTAGVEARTLGKMLVEDALAIVLTKGHATSGEATAIIRFAHALGIGNDELIAASPQLAPWLVNG